MTAETPAPQDAEMAIALTKNEVAHFWSKVDKTETCWLWNFGKNSTGYGSFWSGSQYRSLQAHRVAYLLLVGDPGEGLVLDHICRIRHCVNPEHLRPVTSAENILAGISPSAINARKTHCKRGHELAGDNLLPDKRGQRICRECAKAKWRRMGVKKKAKRAAARLAATHAETEES